MSSDQEYEGEFFPALAAASASFGGRDGATADAEHRAGFRLFWRLRSRPKSIGRPTIDAEVRAIICRMVMKNPTWGTPRIHGELLKLGFQISERTVSRYIRRLTPSDQECKLWAIFLRYHRNVTTAMDLFTVPTLIFRVLYCSSSSNTAGDASSILLIFFDLSAH